jgi:hypothetical protein
VLGWLSIENYEGDNMTRIIVALVAAAMSIAGATAAAAQAVYVYDENSFPPPIYVVPPTYATPPAYVAPAPVYVAPPAYAAPPPVYAPPAPAYIPRGYVNRPRMIYDAGYGYAAYRDW